MPYQVPARPRPVPLTPKRGPKRSIAHSVALALVWVTVASGAFVFAEPAPIDALTSGLLVLLPVAGLVAWHRSIIGGFMMWLGIAAFGFLGASLAHDPAEAATHTAVTLYLSAACFLFAAFVAKRPGLHTSLILNAMLAASVLAATLGIAGYLNLFPEAAELFTRYGRAAGPFKDPNVYGPFLIAGLLTSLHLWLTRPVARGFGPLLLAVILTVGILFSFSRGAWAAALAALAIYGYLYLGTAKRNVERLKLGALILLGSATIGLIVAVALQSDSVAGFLKERAAFTQAYDEGPEGRFGGQEKAFALILDNPFGIGSHQFSPQFHHEEPHNVYLSMLLNTGWIGGGLYFLIAVMTLALGFAHALKNTKTQHLFFIVYASLTANVLEGALIDTDHWRHMYLLMGCVWGLMAGDRRNIRRARIVADHRPYLMQQLVLVPPARRQGKIVGRVLDRHVRRPALKLVTRRPADQRPPRILANLR